ncbi:phosphoribosyl-AMP cyclohydrolase [Blastopirellula marina DSM 3645]|uniref:Phosphoribosyl-AMP cyclohydrolase n=2 Tax=Blastopirellula marina TaxID=124 RepID=A3ZTQ2_9BACT|nr:phosphoribosyl-AMP cyclohydrolase [Blastopirellula marina DSM 3645]
MGRDNCVWQLPLRPRAADLTNTVADQQTGLVPSLFLKDAAAMPIDLPREPDFAKAGGLVPAIAQDADNGDVLMMAWMNAEAFAETLATNRAVYFSRSRGKLWRKGEESGHVQTVVGIFVDCDADTVLLKVRQAGAACHEGYRSCFFRQITTTDTQVVGERLVDPAEAYRKKP